MRMRFRRGPWWAAILSALAFASAGAHAQTAPASGQRGERSELAFAPEGAAPVEGPAGARDRTRARELTAQATNAYRDGNFARALALFEQAYALVPAPELLFNLGQCQRHLQRNAQAQRSFRAYLRARPNAPEREQIERWIASSTAAQRVARPEPRRAPRHELAPSAARLPQTAAPPARATVVEHALVEPQTPNRALVAASKGPEARAQRDEAGSIVERWWFWTAVGVAVGGGITATLLLSDDDEPAAAGSLGTVRWD
jgi:tetratricopeptide (TPR) repeat protein